MRTILLRSLAVIGVGGLVLAGMLYVASTVDARPPEVVAVRVTQPVADDDRLALITTSLEIVFSEPVDQEAAAGAIQIEPTIVGAVSWSGSTMIFTPADPLELDSTYRLTLGGGIRDRAGNAMSELPPPFEFATTGRPTLVVATPADGATDVPLDDPLELTFSTLMDTASVEAELRLRPSFPHELRWSGELLEIVPTGSLRPGQEYTIVVQAGASDVAGVELETPITIRFRTVVTGLVAELVLPADGIDGIALTTPIAIVFDRRIDPDSVEGDFLTISPEVAGTLEVATAAGEPPSDDGSGSVLLFTPSSALPPNTTFEVELARGLTSTTGGGLGGPVTWSFTTGAPLGALSNQITFLSDRAGITNVWAMNPDGTGKRQLTAEMSPIVDYAVAPDGTSLVVGDGRRLVYQRAEGSDRRILTGVNAIEFDPAYAPDSQHVAFARADATTGAGEGLWEWAIGGGDATPVEVPPVLAVSSSPLPSASGAPAPALRAPRYAPDGQALAYVDLAGWVGVLELPADRLTRVPFVAGAAPTWLPDSTGVLLVGHEAEPRPAPRFLGPVTPLAADAEDATFRLWRSATALEATPFGVGARVIAVAPDGRIAYVDRTGALWLTPSSERRGSVATGVDEPVVAGSFAPGEPALALGVGADAEGSRIDRLDLASGERDELAPDGFAPRWLP
jgi:Big-like domain-containing protein